MKKHYFIILVVILFSCSEEPGDLKEYYFFTDPDNFILSVDNDRILADGVSYAELTVQGSDTVLQRYSEIKLDVQPIGKFSNNLTSLVLPFDNEGVAKAKLYSDSAGMAVLSAWIGPVKRIIEMEFFTVGMDSLLLIVKQENVPADNSTYAKISAINVSKHEQVTTINFTADFGTFSNNDAGFEVHVSSHDTANVFLKSKTAGLVRVTASIGGSVASETMVRFLPSLPDQLIIEPDSSSLRPLYGSKSKIKAKLTKYVGTVSEGQVLLFSDSSSTGASVGSFLNTTLSDSNGMAFAEYWVQDTSYHGFVYIKGKIITNEGFVSGMGKIYIK